MRTNKVREDRNRAKRSKLRSALKKVRDAADGDAAEEAYTKAKSLLDRAASRRLIHPNRAARIKSQLAAVAKEKGATAN